MRNVRGIVVGRFDEYPKTDRFKKATLKAMKDLGLENLPVLYNLPFGHARPICTLPYGVAAEIDCENISFNIMESGVKAISVIEE